MFVWWLLGSIGYLCVGVIYCQENVVLADIEPRPDNDVRVDLAVDDSPLKIDPKDTNTLPTNEGTATETTSTTTPIPEAFSCHECTNCNSKSDFTPRPCVTGVTMCYTIHKRINNATQINRGCSTSKGQCTVPDDGQSNSRVETITCCTGHKCNQATQFKPVFFLLIISLFTILITIINT